MPMSRKTRALYENGGTEMCQLCGEQIETFEDRSPKAQQHKACYAAGRCACNWVEDDNEAYDIAEEMKKADPDEYNRMVLGLKRDSTSLAYRPRDARGEFKKKLADWKQKKEVSRTKGFLLMNWVDYQRHWAPIKTPDQMKRMWNRQISKGNYTKEAKKTVVYVRKPTAVDDKDVLTNSNGGGDSSSALAILGVKAPQDSSTESDDEGPDMSPLRADDRKSGGGAELAARAYASSVVGSNNTPSSKGRPAVGDDQSSRDESDSEGVSVRMETSNRGRGAKSSDASVACSRRNSKRGNAVELPDDGSRKRKKKDVVKPSPTEVLRNLPKQVELPQDVIAAKTALCDLVTEGLESFVVDGEEVRDVCQILLSKWKNHPKMAYLPAESVMTKAYAAKADLEGMEAEIQQLPPPVAIDKILEKVSAKKDEAKKQLGLLLQYKATMEDFESEQAESQRKDKKKISNKMQNVVAKIKQEEYGKKTPNCVAKAVARLAMQMSGADGAEGSVPTVQELTVASDQLANPDVVLDLFDGVFKISATADGERKTHWHRMCDLVFSEAGVARCMVRSQEVLRGMQETGIGHGFTTASGMEAMRWTPEGVDVMKTDVDMRPAVHVQNVSQYNLEPEAWALKDVPMLVRMLVGTVAVIIAPAEFLLDAGPDITAYLHAKLSALDRYRAVPLYVGEALWVPAGSVPIVVGIDLCFVSCLFW